MLLQILDDGRATDGQGRTVNFLTTHTCEDGIKRRGEEAGPRARATYKPARRHLVARARSDERVQQLLGGSF